MLTRNVVQKAIIKTIPVMAGYLVVGIGFGILLEQNGYGVLWALAMSTFIYAGSMQFVGASLLVSGSSLITVAVTTLMVNARHLFYGISMLGHYRSAGKYKPYLVLSLTDETYSLLCDGDYPKEEDPNLYRMLVSLFDHIYWIAGSVLGSLASSALDFNFMGIDFAMTALFISTYVSQWMTAKNHIPSILGIVCSLICRLIFGSSGFLIPSMLCITFVLTIMQNQCKDTRAEVKENAQ